MAKNVLVTGGAGFIGSHLVDELLRLGHRVKVLDSLSQQVHGSINGRPENLNLDAELIAGDIRDHEALRKALHGVEAVYHLASAVGVGQSMYRIADYTSVNCLGTAALLEAIVERPVERLVVASSMSVYGEGLYQGPDGSLCPGTLRPYEQLRARQWEVRSASGKVMQPVPTPETKPPGITSVYALDKYHQEQLCLAVGRAYQIPAVALRFFNVYGTRQSLSNPYTGVLAIFASRLLNGKRPLVFEDGLQMRDFVCVSDVVRGCVLALEKPEAAGRVFNIGTGRPRSIEKVALSMARALGREDLEPEITAEYRAGDIRHCFADIGLAQRVLGYAPQVMLDEGLAELAEWLTNQVPADRVEEAMRELAARGLSI
jgi:dTDP-L-rhamnose 4-epimerase